MTTDGDQSGSVRLEHSAPRPAPIALRQQSAEPATPAHDPIRVRLASIIFLALIAVLATLHGWRPGQILAPTDALKMFAPWAPPGPEYIARNEQLLDQTTQFVPWTRYAVGRYRSGHVPLWNPYCQLGAPLLGNGQSAVLYPTMLLHGFLPETWSWTLSAAIRLFVAGLGVWLLAGLYGQRGIPRLLSAVSFELCGFAAVWLNHPQMNVLPLLPWAVLITETLLQRVTLASFAGGALVFGLQFLGGHPSTSVHLLVTCGLVVLLRWKWPRRVSGQAKGIWFKGALTAGGVIVLGFALAAAQWLPLVEYAQNSGAKIVRDEKLHDISAFSLDPRYLIGLVFPYANGYSPDRVTPFEMRLATHLPNTNELAAGFVGLVPLFLGMLAIRLCRRKREVLLWTIIAAISAAIAIRLPGIDHLVRLVPLLNVSQNARMLVITALSLSLLSGFGLEAVFQSIREGRELRRLRKTAGWLAVILSAVATVSLGGLYFARGRILAAGYERVELAYQQQTEHEHSLEHVRSMVDRVHAELMLTSVRLLIPATVLLGIWLLLRRGKHPIPWLAIASIELLGFAIPFNPGSPSNTWFPPAPAIARLGQLPPHRVSATHRTLVPELSTAYGLRDLRGYDALAPQRYYQWWAHPGIGNLPEKMQGYISRMSNINHPAWSLLNFGYLMTAPDQPAPEASRWKSIYRGADASIYQAARILPRARLVPTAQVLPSLDAVLDGVAAMDFDPQKLLLLDGAIPPQYAAHPAGVYTEGRVEFLVDEPEHVRFRVTGANGGWLVLADSYFPGWTASIREVEGNSAQVRPVTIAPAYGVLRAVPIPKVGGSASPGAYEIEFKYQPKSWRVGWMTSLSAGGILALFWAAALWNGCLRRIRAGESTTKAGVL